MDTYKIALKYNSTSEKPMGQPFPNNWPQGYPEYWNSNKFDSNILGVSISWKLSVSSQCARADLLIAREPEIHPKGF